MAHILFDGDIRRHPAIRSLLWQWGVTVGSLSSGAGDGSQATVEECDAVVHMSGTGESSLRGFGAMPDGAEKEGAAVAETAPLLVIGSGLVAVKPWIVIPDPGPGGSLLRAALQSCGERSGFLRGDPVTRQDRDRFRDFLGHELRSPLTAIQTALSILQSDGSLQAGPERMLGIARRNLARLTETVEWSQELRSLAEATPAPDLDSVLPEDLVRSFPEHLVLKLDAMDESCGIFTDPRLLGTLAGQMARVLAYACPGGRPEFRLEFDPETGCGNLIAGVDVGEGKCDAPRVARTGIGAAGAEQGDWSMAEFRNLARMMISPQLLQVLGVRIRVSASSAEKFLLTLEMPACPKAPVLAPDPTIAV